MGSNNPQTDRQLPRKKHSSKAENQDIFAFRVIIRQLQHGTEKGVAGIKTLNEIFAKVLSMSQRNLLIAGRSSS